MFSWNTKIGGENLLVDQVSGRKVIISMVEFEYYANHGDIVKSALSSTAWTRVELFTKWRLKAVKKSILLESFWTKLKIFKLLSAMTIWVCCLVGRKRTIIDEDCVAQQHLVMLPCSDCQFISIIADVLIFIPNLIEARSRGVVLFVCVLCVWQRWCSAITIHTMWQRCIVCSLIAIKINDKNIPLCMLTIDYFQYRVFPSSCLFSYCTQWCIKIVCASRPSAQNLHRKKCICSMFPID